jgi:hypothetical protein
MPEDRNESEDFGTPGYWCDILLAEFKKESDRAAVILVASLLDVALESLIRNSLVPNPCREDELFDPPNAPLSSFSAKISFAHRLGLVSRKFSRDLHLIRKIRNEFAHNVRECTFASSPAQSRITELMQSSGIKGRNPKLRAGIGVEGARGDFLLCAVWMLWALNQTVESCAAHSEAKEEWVYSHVYKGDKAEGASPGNRVEPDNREPRRGGG